MIYKKIRSLTARYTASAQGATAIEYSLIAVGIAVAIVVIVIALGGSVATLYGKVQAGINH